MSDSTAGQMSEHMPEGMSQDIPKPKALLMMCQNGEATFVRIVYRYMCPPAFFQMALLGGIT